MLRNKMLAVFTALVLSMLCLPPTVLRAATPSPLVTLTLGANTKVLGLTAQNSLGKKTGTLEEFAATVVNDQTAHYTLFPGNFFGAYDDVKEIVGGIYSQGTHVFESYFDYGCGFDVNNRFYLFNLQAYTYTDRGRIMAARDAYGNDAEIMTAFNCYPWLIKDGAALEISPFPGADASFLNRNALRAFMGQKADGTFMYGMLSSATIRETQQACQELGLVNAVNTDGGASAGVYRDGAYLANPGRELASVVCIIEEKTAAVPAAGIGAAAAAAAPVASAVYIDGAPVHFEAYNIGGSNYFKLRDIAFALNGTGGQFEVGYDQSKAAVTVTSGVPYTVVSGELTPGDGTAKTAIPAASRLYLDGAEQKLASYNIGGSVYFKLADLMGAIGIPVGYVAAADRIVIDTRIGLDGGTAPVQTPGASEAAPPAAAVPSATAPPSNASQTIVLPPSSTEQTVATGKTVYAPGETILVTLTGITPEMIEARAFAAIFDAGAVHSAWQEYHYPDSAAVALEFTAPSEPGRYEMRLYRKDFEYTDETFVTAAAFAVGAQ